jgi:DUF971 family protein
MSKKPVPTDIILHQASHELEISFSDGVTWKYPTEFLRVFSPSAEVRGHWGQGAKLQLDKQNVNISEIRPVGQYAIKIVYDDGHDSGLYDWAYLYDLGKKQALYWTDYLDRLNAAGHTYSPPDHKKT